LWNSRTRPLDLRSNAPGWSCLRYNALPLFLLIYVYFFEPSDLWSDGPCASCVYFSFCVVSFFKPFDLNQTAVMIYFMIKSGPPDSLDGPDLICLSQPINPYCWTGSTHPGPSLRTDPFLMLKPNIFYCSAKYTSVFHYYTFFFSKFYFLFVFFHLKIIFSLY